MFIVTDRYTFTRPVPVFVPVDGGHEKQECKATFKVMPVEQAKNHDLTTGEGASEFLKGIIVELGDLIGGDKQPVLYNNAVRDHLLQFSFIRHALVNTYFEAINKAAEGN